MMSCCLLIQTNKPAGVCAGLSSGNTHLDLVHVSESDRPVPLQPAARCPSGPLSSETSAEQRRCPGPLRLPGRSVSRSDPSSLSDAKAPKSRGIRFSSRSGGGRDENKPSRAELVPSCSNFKLPELNTLTSCRGFHNKSVVVEPPW